MLRRKNYLFPVECSGSKERANAPPTLTATTCQEAVLADSDSTKASYESKPRRFTSAGDKFGRLTVVERRGSRGHDSMWLCRCECGGEIVIRSTKLRIGHTKSCGCLGKGHNRTHGMSGTRTSRMWRGMRQRCRNPKNLGWSDYGGRGIEVCERWDSFENFLADMGECPEGHSIERADVNGHYDPDNCIWLPLREQQRNTRRTIWIEIDGRRMIAADWAREFGTTHKGLKRLLSRRMLAGGRITIPMGWVKGKIVRLPK